MSAAASTGIDSASADRIVRALVRARIEIAASLPDSWLSALIARIESEPTITHVRVTREDDGAGICAGASLGGKRAVLVCQNAGVLLSANALAGYAHHHQLPFLVLAVYRGSHEDRFYYQMYKGLVTEPVLRGLALPFHVVERAADVDMIEDAAREATLTRKPVVVLLRRAALVDADAPS